MNQPVNLIRGSTVKEYLTPTEVVERYQGKITVRTLANWRSQGVSPPFTKVGGRILYPLEKLIEWERRRTVSGTSMYGKMVCVSQMLTGIIPFL